MGGRDNRISIEGPFNNEEDPSRYADYDFELKIIEKKNAHTNSSILKKLKLQSTPDNSNLQGKLKKVRVFGSSSYRG